MSGTSKGNKISFSFPQKGLQVLPTDSHALTLFFYLFFLYFPSWIREENRILCHTKDTTSLLGGTTNKYVSEYLRKKKQKRVYGDENICVTAYEVRE